MAHLCLCPLRDTPQKNIFQYKELETCSHVFLRRITIAPPLTAPYDGPYKVIVKSSRVMKIFIKGKVETVSLDRVKPAHFECEPETSTAIKRKTQSKTTNLKTSEIVRGTRKDRIRSSSTLTQKSDRTRVKSKTSTQTQSAATEIDKSPAITPQNQTNRVNSPGQLTPYIAPHSRTPAVSSANGSKGGLRTYSCVPLLLRGETLNTNDTLKRPDVRNNSSIANNNKTILDYSVKQTRVGRKIHTPARFVQMVHAIVAANDIYGRTNCPYRNNHNL